MNNHISHDGRTKTSHRQTRLSYTILIHYFIFMLVAAGIFYLLYSYYEGLYSWPRLFAQGALVAIALGMTFVFCLYGKAMPPFGWPTGKRDLALVGAVLAFYVPTAVGIAFFALQNFPNSADEYDYWFQAMTFAEGRLWNDAPVLPEFFRVPWMIIKDGKWLTQYDPGWPAVLALAITVDFPPWLVGPLVGTLSLMAFYAFGRHVHGHRVTVLAMAVLAVTPFFIFNTASYFNHNIAGLLAILFVYFTVRTLESHVHYHAVLAGVFLGALGTTRLYSAFLFFLPVIPMFCRGGLKTVVTRGAWLCLGGAPFLIGLLVYNYLVTGNPLVLVKTWGYPNLDLYPMTSLLMDGGLHKSFVNTMHYMFEIGDYVWPLFLVAYVGALLLKVGSGSTRFYDFYFFLFIIGFFLFAEKAGNRYGPRYYFEGFPFAVLTVCSAFCTLVRSRQRFTRLVAIHIFLSQVLIGMVNIPFLAWLHYRIVSERMDLFNKVENTGISNALVFITDSTGVIREMAPRGLVRNGLQLGDIIYAQDLGERNPCLIAHFPDREIWRYTRAAGARQGALQKMEGDNPDFAVDEKAAC